MQRLTGRRWMRIRAAVLRGATHCTICGEPLDWQARPMSTRAPSVDHITPVSQGGTNDPSNLRPAHHGCNSRRGAPTRQRTHLTW